MLSALYHKQPATDPGLYPLRAKGTAFVFELESTPHTVDHPRSPLHWPLVWNASSVTFRFLAEAKMCAECVSLAPVRVRKEVAKPAISNTIERAVTLAHQLMLTPEDLPAEVREGVASEWSHDLVQDEQSFFSGNPTLDEVTKRYVRYVLSRTQGNLSRAAKILHIDHRSFYRMVERLKIAPFAKESA